MDLATSWRHLLSAVLRLGADEGTVDERLREAYAKGLRRISRNPSLPDHLRQEYEQLMSELDHLFGSGDEIDIRRASRLAKRVVALYDHVNKELQ